MKWTPEYETIVRANADGTFDDYWKQPELFAAGHYDAFDDSLFT